ncbi:MAG: GH92 family glycosyl hydrolase [Saprospiraceae bacterium]|nr:GH92 family glycosyl hydrolase [Saprospiraceae bacterium]
MDLSQKIVLRIYIVMLVISFGTIQTMFAGPDNIAMQALVSSSTDLNSDFSKENIADGLIAIDGKGEWACQGETTFWGYIRYPWIKLTWEDTQFVDRIILYDRATLTEHTAGGTLFFSDGSEVVVTAIPNDGSAKLVTFPAKKTTWIKFQVTDGDGKNLGLSEIEVFPSEEGRQDLVDWVNPFIETTRGRYFFFTPGSLPFGMIATAPHTRLKNQWGGGYNYNSTDILGFGQLHGWMLSGIDIMPTTGLIDPTKGHDEWKSPFSHDDEIAQPGYQRVFLKKYKIWVENSVTERVSFYQFRFTKTANANILVNLGGYLGSTTMTQAVVNKVNDHSIEGSFVSTGRLWGGPKEIKVFFVIDFDKPFNQMNGWKDHLNLPSINTFEGATTITRRDSMTYGDITQSYWDSPGSGVSLSYPATAGDLLKMKIGISFTSIENARQNLAKECNHWDFEKVHMESRQIWNNWLSKIEVNGGTHQQKEKFYTDLWHVLLGRQIIDDVDGSYPDYTQGVLDWKFTDAKMIVHNLPRNSDGTVKFHMYTSDALWLTQWNLNILWGLGWPSVLDDFSASMVQYADNGGLLPRGPCVGGYSYIMTGCPATSMIVSANNKGMLTRTNPLHALEVIRKNHEPGGMMGDSARLQFYIDHGWCPGNAGETLEWCFQDWAAGQMAKKLGQNQLFEAFEQRSSGWKHLFNSEQRLLFPKTADSTWLQLDPLSGEGWIEANAWQGSWSVSHDIPALASLQGGNDTLCRMLNFAFEQAADDDFVFGYGSGYVSYANQPGCSNAHVFNYAGQPWLSQYWVRRVNEQAYGGITPDRGYGGHDEDQGQMGGVSALMSMGLFSLKGNTSADPLYEITSPVFDEIIIHLDHKYYSGDRFIIRTHNNSAKNVYIQKAQLNGKDHPAVWLKHEDFAKGGVLDIWLDQNPNKKWGTVPFPE